jgi:hypothetical protein
MSLEAIEKKVNGSEKKSIFRVERKENEFLVIESLILSLKSNVIESFPCSD